MKILLSSRSKKKKKKEFSLKVFLPLSLLNKPSRFQMVKLQ